MTDSKLGRAGDDVVRVSEDTQTTAVCGTSENPTEMSTAASHTSDAQHRRKPSMFGSVQWQADYPKRGPTPYLLSGFDCFFLDGRTILFAQPLASGRVCAGCSAVPAKAQLLPCGNILCELCLEIAFANQERGGLARDQDGSGAPRSAACPQDGAPFVETDLEVHTFRLEHLHRELAFCANAQFGCSYRAEVRHLKEHYLYECRFSPKTCSRGSDILYVMPFAAHDGRGVSQTEDRR
ncbi:hypothetical protein HPB49_011936 [Dermacentor silvarum]|uniref:Uncharacterized protein n=1 Tax=Dermacentor silvarum TaxID=543639 RepID=A0ACB8DJ26_DERSI|nr:hypothetical protein HPB49_011936 [Dermacentor silvarum]